MGTEHHKHVHFKGKDALGHVIEAQAEGLLTAGEVHGTESPGYLAAGCDAARETAIFIALAFLLLDFTGIPLGDSLKLLFILALSWTLWKFGRSTWLGWFRLERLHRVMEQEQWEIEHHRQQERDELRVLYAAKGFEGKLLEDVLDVLMADNARLLKVMVEEELGLTLASQEHPLIQGFGAAIGAFLSASLCLLLLWLLPAYGLFIGVFLTFTLSSYYLAVLNSNEAIPAITWNLGLAAITLGSTYFILQWLAIGTT